MSTLSDLVIKIGADSSGLSNELKKTQGEVKQAFNVNPVNEFSNALTGATASVGGFMTKLSGIAAIAAGGFGLSSMISSAVEAGESVYQLSNKLHITAAEAGQLSRILKLTGGDAQMCGAAFMRLDKNISSGSEEGKKALAVLDLFGVSLTDNNGKLLPMNDQLKNLSAGYQKASQAGYAQEFVMNTLGVRGMALTKTLQNYNEAAANAAKIKSIGLNPQEMHEMSQQLKLMDMQMGQLKLASGAALAPIASEIFPVLLSGLSESARYLAENKTEIKNVTKNAIEFLAVYKTIQAASKISSGIAGMWQNAKLQTAQSAGNQTNDIALTAAQERSINKRVRLLEQAAEKEKKEIRKTVAAMEIAEAEKVKKVTESCIKIDTLTAERAENERVRMTKAYMAINVAAEQSAIAQSTSLRGVGIAADETAAQIVLANSRAAESATVAAGANTRLAESSVVAGSAAAKAGETAVIAHTESAAAAQRNALANTELATKTAIAGTAATTTGVKTVSAMATATTAIKGAASAVWALAGGWLGVAVAIGYGINKLWEMYDARNAVDALTHDNGAKSRFNYETNEWEVERAPDAEHMLNWWGTANTWEKELIRKTTLKKEEAEKKRQAALINDGDDLEISNLKDQAATLLESFKDGKDKEPKEKKEKEEKDTTTHYSLIDKLGDYAGAALAAANAYNIDPNLFGALIKAESSGEPNAYSGSGAIGFTQLMPETAAGLGVNPYDPADNLMGGAAYLKQMLDEFGGDPRLALAAYNAGPQAVKNAGGIPNYDETQNYVANVMGYYSASTTSKGPAKYDQAAENKKLQQAQEEATQLLNSIKSEINDEIGTNYSNGLDKLAMSIARKREQIAKLEEEGINTTTLKAQLGEYEKVMQDKVVDKWRQAWINIKDEQKSIMSSLTDDFAASADAEYEITVHRLDQERKEKLKSVQQDKNDLVALEAVNQWYNASVMAADKKRNEALRESHSKLISTLANNGQVQDIIDNLNNNPLGQQQDIDLEGQKNLANEYVKIWNAAHSSIYDNLATASDSLYSTMSDSMSEFCQGTKSAIDVVHDFGKSVLSTISQIVAKRAAAQITGSLMSAVFGGLSGGSSGGTVNSSWHNGTGLGVNTDFLDPYKFADGGIVTGPTLGLIGEAGKNELVMPLTNENLSAIGGKSGSGKVIVNITNNSDSKVEVQNSRYDAGLQQTILDVVVDGASRNVGGFGNNMKQLLR